MTHPTPTNPIGQSAREARRVTAGRWAALARELEAAAGAMLEVDARTASELRQRVGRLVALEAVALRASSRWPADENEVLPRA